MPSKKAQQTILNINKPVKQENKSNKSKENKDCDCSRCDPKSFKEYSADLQAETFIYLHNNDFNAEDLQQVVFELLSCASRWFTFGDGTKKEFTKICSEMISDFLAHKQEIIDEITTVSEDLNKNKE